ncbi:response regulator [Parapedobacter composti]|uniref:hypothetical protein n=1 Tax=Parapedobacter composti TaxID=623281 RepID=UPI001FCD3193|nr:hypothetical protein [Parapedobacter composti]
MLRDCKQHNPDAAIIILTARGDLEDRIKGLEMGPMITCRSRFHCWNRKCACKPLPGVSSASGKTR